jgi:hypothetical protein
MPAISSAPAPYDIDQPDDSAIARIDAATRALNVATTPYPRHRCLDAELILL